MTQKSQSGALLTVEQAAERLQVTPRQIRRYLEERRLAFIELPRGRRISEAALADFVAARTVGVA